MLDATFIETIRFKPSEIARVWKVNKDALRQIDAMRFPRAKT